MRRAVPVKKQQEMDSTPKQFTQQFYPGTFIYSSSRQLLIQLEQFFWHKTNTVPHFQVSSTTILTDLVGQTAFIPSYRSPPDIIIWASPPIKKKAPSASLRNPDCRSATTKGKAQVCKDVRCSRKGTKESKAVTMNAQHSMAQEELASQLHNEA